MIKEKSFWLMCVGVFLMLAAFVWTLPKPQTTTTHTTQRITLHQAINVDSLASVLTDSIKAKITPQYIVAAQPNNPTAKPETIYLPTQADTLAILEHYYTHYTFSTTHKDSNINILINQQIARNAVQKTELTYHWLRADTHTTTTINHHPTPQRMWFVGGFAHASPNYVAAGPHVTTISKNKTLIGGNVDIVNRGFGVNAGIPINNIFKRKKSIQNEQ
jgi:hypothetical protein